MDDLTTIRGAIDAIDMQIVKALIERSALSKRVGVIKRKLDVAIENPDIEQSKIDRYVQLAEVSGVNADLIQNVFEEIFFDSRRAQDQA